MEHRKRILKAIQREQDKLIAQFGKGIDPRSAEYRQLQATREQLRHAFKAIYKPLPGKEGT